MENRTRLLHQSGLADIFVRRVTKVKPKMKTVHVGMNIKGQWGVRLHGASKAYKLFRNYREARAYGKKWSWRLRTGVVMHAPDGHVWGRYYFYYK